MRFGDVANVADSFMSGKRQSRRECRDGIFLESRAANLLQQLFRVLLRGHVCCRADSHCGESVRRFARRFARPYCFTMLQLPVQPSLRRNEPEPLCPDSRPVTVPVMPLPAQLARSEPPLTRPDRPSLVLT